MELPYELWWWIFSMLPSLKDIARCRLVCSSWAKAYQTMPLENLFAVYPGGSKPDTRRGLRYELFKWLNWTMNRFEKLMKQRKYEQAMYWAITWGHLALICQLVE